MFLSLAVGVTIALWTACAVCWLCEKGVFKDAEKHLKAQSWTGRFVCGGLLSVAIVYGGAKPDSGGGSPGRGRSAASRTSGDASTNSSRIAESDYAAGFVLQNVGTNETFDFTAPVGASVATNWMRHGASSARVTGRFPEWTFPFGNSFLTNLAAFASGTVMPDVTDTNVCFSVFAARLGIVPEANWGLLDETNRPSAFWWSRTDWDAVVLTWQNVLLDRAATNPVSFQAEFRPGGSFVYRYDLSRLVSDELLTNVTVGARNADGAWLAPTVGRTLTSLSFQRVTEADRVDQDRDGDGIPTESEIFDFGTDPDQADSDFDGVPDAAEVAAGLGPLNRDTDGDGLVDGSDPDPLTVNGDVDWDGDGINDDYERFWFGNTNMVDDATAVKEDGFTLATEILAGINPTNTAPAAVVGVTNSLVSWKMVGAFAAALPQDAPDVVWEKTFRIGKTIPWQQYFVSAAPDAAAAWRLEGMRLEWEDSNGCGGSAVRSPVGDSFRVPVSSDETENLTLRLRATGRAVRSPTPLYLIAYAPEVKVGGSREIACDGILYSVFADGTNSAVSLTVDRSHRPCNGPLTDEETDMGVLEEMEGVADGSIAYDGDSSGGTLAVCRPGAYPFPDVTVALARPVARRMLRSGGSGSDGHVLLVLDPSVWYGEAHCYTGRDLRYDPYDDWYCCEERYPLNSKCLWRNWSRDVSGRLSCACEPVVSSGIGECPYVSTDYVTDGDKCTGFVMVGGETVWSGEALHVREDDCGGLSHAELLSDLDVCETCEDACTDGDCRHYDGTQLGSLAFRVSVGSPRKGQTDGFVYFKTDGPITVSPSMFSYLFRDDATVSVTTGADSRHVVCSGERGRDILIGRDSGLVRMTVRDRLSGSLDHTWEFSNVDGTASRIRIRKISKLGNPLEDWTFTCENGDWTRFNNIRQVLEELEVDDGLNDPWDGTRSETRTVSDADGNELSYVYTESRRFGERDAAVIRETYRCEWTGLNGRTREADYWCDPRHRARHGRLRLLTGNDRPWEYHDFDADGREILRVGQRNGSPVPGSFPTVSANGTLQLSGPNGQPPSSLDAFVTVYGYAPLAGDDEAGDCVGKVRTETRYVVENGVATPVGRTWWRYTAGVADGHETVKAEKWRAGSPAGMSAPTADGNAYSYETSFTDTGMGTPLVMRGQVVASLDESGILTENAYSVTGGVVVCESRRYGPSRTSRLSHASQFPTYETTETDGAHGLLLRRTTRLTGGNAVIADERSLYDSQNRLRSTAYSDGTSTTNAYSCCRLLWRRDREGRKVLRSAVTGYDQLYYADEEVWLADVSTNGGYRVVQHFFDGLGRETDTLVYVGFDPGEAEDAAASAGKVLTEATTEYPAGGSDLAIRTDERGVVTVTRSDILENALESGEEVQTNGVRVTATKTRTVFGGGSSTRREWGENAWTEERRFTEYDADGRRVDFVVTESHDCGTVTNSVTVSDWLGRTVAVETPLGVTSSIYNGTSALVLRTVYTAGYINRETINIYNDLGEQVGTVIDGVTKRTDLSYELLSNEWWRVTSDVTVGVGTNAWTVAREQLTGLEDSVRRRTVEESSSGDREERTDFFDAAMMILTGTAISRRNGVSTQCSRCGLLLSAQNISGIVTNAYDALGRCVRTEMTKGTSNGFEECRVNVYNDVGDTISVRTRTATNEIVEAYSYDAFGRRTSVLNALGETTETVYDANGNVVSVFGATWPVCYEYDARGRRTLMLMTENGVDWIRTRWSYNPATGLCTAKVYADGTTVHYSYTPDGLFETATYPSGQWISNLYDTRRQLAGTTSSDGAQDSTYVRDAYGRTIVESNAVMQTTLDLNNEGVVIGENRTDGTNTVSLVRDVDGLNRLSGLFVPTLGYAENFAYTEDNLLSAVSNEDAVIVYCYSPDRQDAGYVISFANGGQFTRTVVRDPYRREIVTAVTNICGASVLGLAYTYDDLSRPIARNDDVFAYNMRGEVSFAEIAGNVEEHAYDLSGNSLVVSFNSVTNHYTMNNLNQYTSILRDSVSPCEISPTYDADGNLISCGQWSYIYDSASQLNAVSSNGILLVTNLYDCRHRRVKKITPDATHTFFYDDWDLICEQVEYTNDTIDEFYYYWGRDLSTSLQGAGGVGGLLYVKRNGVIYIPHADANGNILRYTDTAGNIVAEYTYDVFGRTISQSGTLADIFRHRFSTKYFDVETGLYYYGYRFYFPVLMRWLNRDTIGEDGGRNLYAFCENNMLVSFDAFGQVTYSKLAANYPKPSDYPTDITMVNNIWQLIGGMVSYNAKNGQFKNSCAVRLSHSLNKSGEKIPFIKGQTSSGKKTTKGKISTNWWYIYRVAQMKIHLTQKYGNPTIYRKRDEFEKCASKGILVLDINWSDATGHATLWDGKRTIDDSESYFDKPNIIFNLWRLK